LDQKCIAVTTDASRMSRDHVYFRVSLLWCAVLVCVIVFLFFAL